ncbi:hypothetical protein YTPLAS18_17620 [Nitrospira sp.]|nr:hypothetical protein YTPLAS18_17620 [Nitrospira sp.]
MGTRSTADSDAADDFSIEFDGKAATEYQDLLIHVAEGLKRGHLGNQFAEFSRGAAQACRSVGFFPTTVEGMGSRSIAPQLGSHQSVSIHNRGRYPKAIGAALFYRGLGRFDRQHQRERTLAWKVRGWCP